MEGPSSGRPVGAALNRAAARASGEQLLFLRDHAEILEGGWIEELLTYAEIPEVGVLGPLSLYPDGRVRQAGLALRRWEAGGDAREVAWWHGRSPAEPIMRGAAADADGYYGSLSCAREVGAVSASCMLVSRSVFDRVGGFGEEYRAQHHDVDFCLRVRGLGLEIVYTPRPRVVAHEHSPPDRREDVIDRALLLDTWFEAIDRGDPYLNPHLSIAMTPAGDERPGLVRRIAGRR